MNKFDLEKALAGEKVVTRNGQDASQFHVFKCSSNEKYTVSCVIDGMVERHRVSGGFSSISKVHSYDLFMAPKKLSGFVNVYRDGHHTTHASEASANQYCINQPTLNRLARIDLSQFEEGHGL